MATTSLTSRSMASGASNFTACVCSTTITARISQSSSPPARTETVSKTSNSTQHTSSHAAASIPQASEWPTRGDLIALCVGVAVVSLIVGALGMLYLIKRRERRRTSDPTAGNQRSLQEPGQLANIVAAGGPRPITRPGPPLEDGSATELQSSLQQFGDKIQEHVEGTYTLDEIQQDQGTLAQSVAALPFLKHDAQFLAHLCSAPATRHATIRHLIAATILSAINFSTFQKHALLPPPIMTFWENLPPSHGEKRRIEALWQWQKLSLLLLLPDNVPVPRPDPGSSTTSPRLEQPESINPQLTNLKNLLNPFLDPFLPANRDENDVQHRQSEQLEELILAGASLGYTILSHPCRWSFNWQAGDASSGDNHQREMVLVPGLLCVSNAAGEVLDQVVPVGEPMTVEV